MKKVIGTILKVGVVLALVSLFFVPLLNQKSSGVSSTLMDNVINDVRNYYRSTKNGHKMKVSVTGDAMSEKADLINKTISEYKINVSELEKNSSDSDVWHQLNDAIKDESAKANILTGYIKIKRHVDSLFKTGTKSSYNLAVSEKKKNTTEVVYYKYAQVEAPQSGSVKTFLDDSRILKRRVEDLILTYRVTKNAKYMAALKKEIVDAARWENYWISTQYIDTAEAAYAVSLGYDFAYSSLTDAQRYVIENRLLLAVLLYGTETYSNSMNTTYGNYNQVGHSGAGIAALALIESSGEEKIKITSVDRKNKTIGIEYPIKSSKDGKLSIQYSNKIRKDGWKAEITDSALFDIILSKYGDLSAGNSIHLRILYAAVIAKTTDYLPKVLKSNNMYIDGTYPEGKNYFLYGMRYFSYYLATLQNTLHDDYNMLNFENNTDKSRYVLNNIVLNPVYIANAKGGNGGNFDFGDSSANTASDRYGSVADDEPGRYGKEDDLFYLANVNAQKGGYKKTAELIYDYRKRTARPYWSFYSIMWYNEKYDKTVTEADYENVMNEAFYKNQGVAKNINRLGVSAFRSSYTKNNSLFVAMKGGANSDNHIHLDLGTYVLDAMGTRWIADSGSQYGAAKYHDKVNLRWQYYVTRAEAHNTLVINTPTVISGGEKGRCLAADQWRGARAEYEKLSSSENSGFAILNLTDVYNKVANDNLASARLDKNSSTKISVKRGLKVFDHKKYVLVQDEVTLNSLTSFYSFLNVNKNVSVTIPSGKDKKEAILTDANGKKVRVVLKSDNANVRFEMIDAVTGGTGLLNSFINNKSNNQHVNLEKNKDRVNHNKLVVYLHNKEAKAATMKVGVYYIPLYDGNDVDSDMLKLSKMSSWYIPDAPKIGVYHDGQGISSGSTIDGSAVIKISAQGKNKNSEVLRYSLDGGSTWYKYDNSSKKDIERRTISSVGEHKISVLAVSDDGTGIQSDSSKITNFAVTIKASASPQNPSTPFNPSSGSSNKSNNNNLKSLTVGGVNAKTSDKVNYYLTVDNAVSKAVIKAVAEDMKATTSGAGEVKLNVGKNKFQIIVTAENGAKKTYYLVITRKAKEYSPEKIDDAIDGSDKNVSIVVGDGDVLKGDDLEKIKESNKTVTIIKYDRTQMVEFSLSVEGSKLTDFGDIDTNSLVSVNKKDAADAVTGSGQGIYVDFNSDGIPSGSVFAVNVSSKYKDGDSLRVYSYGEGETKLVAESVEVRESLAEFSLTSSSKYFVTASAVDKQNAGSEGKNYDDLYVALGASSVAVVAVAAAGYALIRKTNKKKE